MEEENVESKVKKLGIYRCRRCRFLLFNDSNLNAKHQVLSECTSWYLDDNEIVPWIENLINEAGWTTGKLHCPKCQARVGGFDFVHVIQCTCKAEVVPAIWCTKGKVDSVGKLKVNASHPSSNGNNGKGAEKKEGTLLNPGSSSNGNQTISSPSFGSGSNNENERKLNSGEFNEYQELPLRTGYEENCNFKDNSNEYRTKRRDRHYESLTTARARDHFSLNSETSKELVNPALKSALGSDRSLKSSRHNHCHSRCPKCFADYIYVSQQNTHKVSANDCDLDSSFSSNPAPCAASGVMSRIVSHKTPHYTPLTASQLSHQSSCRTHMLGNCNQHIHQDLEEIREEIAHLYNQMIATENDMGSGRKLKRRRRTKKSSRKEAWGVGSEDCTLHGISKSNLAHRKEVPGVSRLLPETVSTPERCVIPDEHLCAVCLDLLVDPHATPCDHTFCAVCLKQLNYVSEGKPTCPLCRCLVTEVSPRREFKKEIQERYPKIYKKRESEIRVQPQMKWPLPSPTSTRFYSHERNRPQNSIMLFLHSIGVAITITIVTVLVGLFGGERHMRTVNDIRNGTLFQIFKVLLVLLAVCSCIAVGMVMASIVFYAFDFVKFAFFIVLCYVLIMKVMIVVISS